MTRKCGDCSLCCKLMPMPELNKPAGARCKYQKVGVGCRIHARKPYACSVWNCRWLAGVDTGGRPDRAHYVVDIMPDYVTAIDDQGNRQHVQVIQVWIDPSHPEAHRDPRLRAFLERENMPALIRFDEKMAMLIAPPALSEGGKWYEQTPHLINEPSHSAADITRALGPMEMTIAVKP